MNTRKAVDNYSRNTRECKNVIWSCFKWIKLKPIKLKLKKPTMKELMELSMNSV